MTIHGAAAGGGGGWALAHPEFGSSVNPITTRGAEYAHHITASPPGFENPAAALRTYGQKMARNAPTQSFINFLYLVSDAASGWAGWF